MNSRTCYPRPDFEREIWCSLNGPWKFAFDDHTQGCVEHWERTPENLPMQIEVPFPYQSRRSGIGDTAHHEVLWYSRDFTVPEVFFANGRRVLIHFGAVDWLCDVWINGRHVCHHEGGYTPFCADITCELEAGVQNVTVRVEDSIRCDQPRGKQGWSENPDRCWYTPCSGIWQSVWLESVPEIRIESFGMEPELRASAVNCTLVLNRKPSAPCTIEAEITYHGRKIAIRHEQIRDVVTTFTLPVKEEDYVDEVHYWTPEHPNLYDVRLTLCAGEDCDRVKTYFGMRSVQVKNGRVLLNNRPFYQKLLLHQGYYDGGLLTAESDDTYRADLQLIKDMGFNGIRMHQKIEDPLLYYWADKLGLVVWGELPSCYEFNAIAAECTTRMMREFIRRDGNHPSIICWVPLNESWGVRNIYDNAAQQRFALSLYHMIRAMDTSRLISTNDGWEQVTSDLCCIHDYAADVKTLSSKWDDVENMVAFNASASNRMIYADGFRYEGQPLIFSEFGGVAYKTNHSDADWGYAHIEETEESFVRRLKALVEYIRSNQSIQGFCYTQFTDVMQEVNGLTDIARKPKIALETIQDIFR